MKQRIYTALILMFSVAISKCGIAQNWSMQFVHGTGGIEHDAIEDINVLSNGDILVTGYFNETVDMDPGVNSTIFKSSSVLGENGFISRFNNKGELLWSKQLFGLNAFGKCLSLTTDGVGNIYSTGFFGGSADLDPNSGSKILTSLREDTYFAKYSNSGSLIYVKQIKGVTAPSVGLNGLNHGSHIRLANNGEVLIAGLYSGYVDFDPDTSSLLFKGDGRFSMYVSRYSNAGDLFNVIRYSSSFNNELNDFELDDNNNYYTAGKYYSIDIDPDGAGYSLPISPIGKNSGFLAKHRLDGTVEWGIGFAGTSAPLYGSAEVNDIVFNGIDAFYLTGTFSGTVDFDPDTANTMTVSSNQSNDIFMAKVDTGGNFLWVKTMGGNQQDEANSIDFDAYGSLYITGFYSGLADMDPANNNQYNLKIVGGQYYNTFIAKYDANGKFIWAVQLGDEGDKIGSVVKTGGDHKVYNGGVFTDKGNFHPGTKNVELSSNGLNDFYLFGMRDFSLSLDEQEVNDESITIYPNPVSTQLYVKAQLEKEVSYHLYDVFGNLIQSGLIDDSMSPIDVSNVSKGIYFLKIPELKTTQRVIKI